jgi:uncharacterized DUF497 family protein
VRWSWDLKKAVANRAKHGLSFETAARVFDDPFHASKPDPHPDGDRWHTIGLVGSVLLLVVHTWPEVEKAGDEPVGRIISARKATPRERKAYEEANL